MFESSISVYHLKKQLHHTMERNGTPLTGWSWEDELSHHKLHRNFEAVDILMAALDRRKELKEQKNPAIKTG